MKFCILFILSTACQATVIVAQNLVPNPGFEDYHNCPVLGNGMGTSQVVFPLVDRWYKPTQGSTDYFNVCGDSFFGIPINENGFQYAHTGNGYCGIIALTKIYNNYREYLQVKLAQPLIKDHLYCVQFYVSNSTGFDSGGNAVTPAGLAVNSLGAYFSAAPVTALSGVGPVLNYQPQVINDPNHLLIVQHQWEIIKGIMIADGGEEYLTVGNFLNDAATVDTLIDPFFSLNSQAYYYVDDVAVSDMNLVAGNLGNDTTLCEGQSLILDATHFQADSYLWQDQSTDPVYTVHDPGIYKVQISYAGCGTITDSIRVDYTPLPVVDLRNDTVLCAGTSIPLEAMVNTPVNYLWQDGNVTAQLITSTDTLYRVQVTNQCGISSDSVRISFTDCDCNIYIPNAFTPNGDGLNDLFVPFFKCRYLHHYHLRIYNRWSQLVFETGDPDTGWNGDYLLHPAEMGAYLFYLAYDAGSNNLLQSKSFHGNLTLIR